MKSGGSAALPGSWRLLQLAVFIVLAAALIRLYVLVAIVHGDVLSAWPYYKMPDADFTNIWAAGALARTGHLSTLYSSAGFEAWKQALLSRRTEVGDWIYPPGILPLGALLSFIPLPFAFWGWNAASLAAMALVLRRAGLGWAVIALTILSPAEYRCLCLGQFGGICGCLAFAGLLLARQTPILSGILLGLVTLKPQPGVIIPIAWLAARNWRALLAGAATFAILSLIPLLWFGPQSWLGFFTQAGPAARAILQAPFPQTYQLNGVSIFWMLRSLGAGNHLAYAAQTAGAVGAAILVYRAWARGGDILLLSAFTIFLSLFIMPYAYNTDMVGYTAAVAALAAHRGWKISLLDGLLWLWPGYVTIVTYTTGFLATPLIVALAAFMAWRALPSTGRPS